MKTPTTALALLVAAASLAGCANNDGDAPPTPTEATPSPTPTPTPTPTPVVPTVTTPTAVPTFPTPTPPTLPPPVANVTPTVRAVYVVSLTDAVAPGGNADVCWRVEGTGSIPHTAIHFDNETHPNATAFALYDGGAVYPDNGAPTGRTYALPGTLCAQLRGLNSTTYLRPHALAPGTSVDTLGPEKAIPVGETRNITIENFLEVFPANFNNSVCWRISGLMGSTTHTAIHWDAASHPNATSFAEYDDGLAYANNSAATGFNVTLPGTFCANLTMPASGTVYLRAHVIHNGVHHLSEERSVQAAPRLTVSGGLPASAAAGSAVQVCWRAEGTGSVAHTAIHFDSESHPDATNFTAYDGGAVYPNNGPATGVTHTLPGPFCGNLTMPASGTLYFRPHAIYSGGHELGPEYMIRVG